MRIQMTKLATVIFLTLATLSAWPSKSFGVANNCESLWIANRPEENSRLLRLATSRLDLRPLRSDDAESVLEMINDPLAKAMSGLPEMDLLGVEKHIQGMKTNLNQFLNPNSEIDLGIFYEGHLVGTINASYWRFPARSGGATYAIGYMVHPAFRNQGFGKEALKRVLRFLFKEAHASDVQAYVYPDNEFSIRMLEGFGFKRGSSPYPKFVNYAIDAHAWAAWLRRGQR